MVMVWLPETKSWSQILKEVKNIENIKQNICKVFSITDKIPS